MAADSGPQLTMEKATVFPRFFRIRPRTFFPLSSPIPKNGCSGLESRFLRASGFSFRHKNADQLSVWS